MQQIQFKKFKPNQFCHAKTKPKNVTKYKKKKGIIFVPIFGTNCKSKFGSILIP